MRQPAPVFPEFDALLPDPAADAVRRRLRPEADPGADRTRAAPLAAAVDSAGVRDDAQALGRALPLTARAYPHVIAQLALCWHDVAPLAGTLDGLLFTERTGRAGFPIEVVNELTEVVRTRLAELRLRQTRCRP